MINKNQRIITILVIFLFPIVQFSFAQTRQIAGKVFNAETGKALSDIKVQVEGSDNNTQTNILGRYRLTIPDSITIPVFTEYPRYKINKTEEVSKEEYNLYISELSVEDLFSLSFEELLNVTVTTAGKKEEKLSDIPASAVVVTREDIEKYGYQSLDEILENVPGLYGNDQKDVSGMIFGVRGFWSGYENTIVFMVNGVRQERMGSDGAVYSALYMPVSSIDRIEVIRGPMSVIYGPGAFFGAINIITNKDDGNDQFTMSAGSLRTTQMSVRESGHSDKLSYTINAGYYDTNGPDVDHSKMSTLDLSEYTRNKSTKDIWGNTVKTLNFSAKRNGFYTNSTFNINKRGLYLIYPATENGGSSTRAYFSGSLGYKKDVSDQLSIDGKLTYHHGSVKADWDWFTEPGEISIGGDYNFREDYEAELNAYFTPGKKLNITTGLYYKRIIHEQLQTYVPFYYSYKLGMLDPSVNQALFAQAEYTFSDHFKLILGARLEQSLPYSVYYRALETGLSNKARFDHDKIEFIPRVALLYNINDRNILKFFYGKAISVPSFFQIAGQASAFQPPLEPEYINTYEINYLASFSEKFNLNTSVFYNDFDNLIVNVSYLDVSTGSFIGGNRNQGTMTTTGMEFSFMAKPFEKFSSELSFTIQKSKDKRDGYESIEVNYSPKKLAYFKASYSFNNDLIMALTSNYVGEMEPYWDHELQNLDGSYGRRIAQKVDGYMTVAANLRINNLSKHGLFFNLHCSNLFNKEFLYPTYTISREWADIGIVGPGRILTITAGWKF